VLIVFSDASAKAYGAAVYLRCQKDGRTVCNLIFSKSKLAPSPGKKKSHRIKRITLPRLELLGATLACRATSLCRKALGGCPKAHLFIDSEVVLQWIRSTDPLQRFVDNRVTEIRKLENVEFPYVHTDSNPAD